MVTKAALPVVYIGPRAVILVNLLCTTHELQLPAPQHGHTQLSSR